MKFTFMHNSIHVLDMEKSLAFYKEALGLEVCRELERDTYSLRFLSDGVTAHQLELCYIHNRTAPYLFDENKNHVALRVYRFDDAYSKHKEMGIITKEVLERRIYFIEDPDGNSIELIDAEK